ncbi:MAG: MazG nucleotide pyrophosphohydrolase domain-containing protein [Candidatus Woesearchaeota archaeon]
MNIDEFQKQVIDAFTQMAKAKNQNLHTQKETYIHLVEEIGEIARQITNETRRPEKFDKENLGEELADAMMFIVYLANQYDIDISSKMKSSIEKLNLKAKFSQSK